MLRKPAVTLFILLVFSFTGQAQTIFTSVEDAWKYAETHNTTIRVAQYEAERSALAKKQSYSALLPQVSATGSFTDNLSLQTTLLPAQIFGGHAGVYVPVQFGQKYLYNGAINGQLDLLNLQSWYNVSVAKATEELSKATLANTRRNTYAQIASNFYSYLLMKEAARLAVQTALISDSVFISMSNKFKEGTVNEIAVNTAKLNLERSQQTNITAQYQMATAVNNIKALLEIPLTDSLIIDASLKGNIENAPSVPFTEDPSIKMAEYQIKINRGLYQFAKSAFLPTLSFAYNASTLNNSNNFEPVAGGPWYNASYYMLKATLPIFSSGNRLWQVKRNKIAWQESKLQYESAIKQQAINDDNTRLGYAKAAAVLEKAADIMNLSYDNYVHSTYRYEAGLTSIDDRLKAFSDYIDYQNQYLNNLSALLVQLYQVKLRQHSFQ